MILNRIKANLLPIVGSALALSVLANVVLGWMLNSALEKKGAFKTAFETQKTEAELAATANANLMTKINTLTSEKQALINEIAANLILTDEALADRDQRIQAANARANEERRKRNELINKTPTCKAFLDGVVADYCPDIAIILRERSQGPAGHQ